METFVEISNEVLGRVILMSTKRDFQGTKGWRHRHETRDIDLSRLGKK